MNTVILYTVAACSGGSCPSQVVQAAPVQPVPVAEYRVMHVLPEVIYQETRRPLIPIFRPQVIVVR